MLNPVTAVKNLFKPKISTVAAQYVSPSTNNYWTGEKFAGGWGIDSTYNVIDYWTLRQRSKELFNQNLYARGLIRRILTNEINAGIELEATPDNKILNITDEEADLWAETIERKFSIWGKLPFVCDYRQENTFGAIQRQARMMALVSGDVLVILRQGSSGVVNVQLVDADNVCSPANIDFSTQAKKRGNKIIDGVEITSFGKQVAYYVLTDNGSFIRVPAYGDRSKRRQAFMLYGTERMENEVRGQSLLALTLQSFKEVDRYRDSEQRAAVINSMLALWIEKGEDKISSMPFSRGAQRKDVVTTQDDSQGRKDAEFSGQIPGLIFQELQHGEKPHSYDTKRPNVNFAVFENAILSAIAWANELPPETLMLQFQSNYSASRAATSEWKMYLNKSRSKFGNEFLSIIYCEFLIAEALAGRIKADGFLNAWRTKQYYIYGAWISSAWSGAIKPNIDPLKEANAYIRMIDNGLITRDRATRELTGMKHSKIVQQLRRENEEFARSQEPLIENGLIKNQNEETIQQEEAEDENATD